MNHTLERILNNSQAEVITDGRKIKIGFFQSHWELSTSIILDVDPAYAEALAQSLADIKWSEKVTLSVGPITSMIYLKQTIFVPSDRSLFEESLANFLETVKEWEDIFATSYSLSENL